MINRSGIEVAVDAEAHRPDVLVTRYAISGLDAADRRSRRVLNRHEASRRRRRLHLGVRNVDTHVEVLGDVPLRPRANGPRLPVVVATKSCNRRNTRTRRLGVTLNRRGGRSILSGAQQRIGLVAVLDGEVAAVD
jgi:hypothetical protein